MSEIWDMLLQVSQVGAPALLALAIWGLVTGWVVPRWIYDREVARGDALQKLYDREKAFNERYLPRGRLTEGGDM